MIVMDVQLFFIFKSWQICILWMKKGKTFQVGQWIDNEDLKKIGGVKNAELCHYLFQTNWQLRGKKAELHRYW